MAIFVLSWTMYKEPSESTQSWAPVTFASELVSVDIFVVAILVAESIDPFPFKSWPNISSLLEIPLPQELDDQSRYQSLVSEFCIML